MPNNAASDEGQGVKTKKPKQSVAVFAGPGLWAISAIGIALLVGLGFIAYYKVGEHSFRMIFMVESSLNLLIFVAILVQAFIYKRQWEAMQDGLDRTDKMIKHSQGQLDVLKDQVSIAEHQADFMRIQTDMMIRQVEVSVNHGIVMYRQLEVIEKQLESMREQAKAATVQAEAAQLSAKIAEESMRLGQRPIVGIHQVSRKGNIAVGEQPSAIVTVVNTGRTPAVNAMVKGFVSITNQIAPFPAEQCDDPPSVMALSPQANYPIEFPIAGKLTENEMGEIRKYGMHILVWGTISYEDLFGESYLTEYCLYSLGPDHDFFNGAPTNNTFK